MSKFERTTYALWFAGLLLCSGFLAAINVEPKNVPSGINELRPEFDTNQLLNDDYYAEIDTYVADWLPTRGLGQWARAQVDYNLFGDSTSSSVVAGRGNWLFFADYIHPDCSKFDDSRPFAGFDLTRDQLVYMVSESKASFYPDKLPDSEKIEPCVKTGRESRRETIRKDPLGMEINQQIQRFSDREDSFLPTDTHWTPLTRTRVAKRIVERFSPDLWNQANLTRADSSSKADLTRLMGLDTPTSLVDFVVDSVGVEIRSERRVDFENLLVEQTSHSKRSNAIPGRTVVIGDSQMAYLLPYLLPYFEDLTFINWLLIDVGKSAFPEIETADRIIIQSVEFAWPERAVNPALNDLFSRLADPPA